MTTNKNISIAHEYWILAAPCEEIKFTIELKSASE